MAVRFSDILAVDIGGTKIAAAVRNGDNLEIISRFPTPSSPEEAVRQIAAVFRSYPKGGITAICIGAPGPLNPETGCFITPPNLPHWHNFPLAARLRDKLDVSVCMENDANLGALGEAMYGSGRGLNSIFYLTISTGIGSGLIINGHIHRGHHAMAGELWAFRPSNFKGVADGLTMMDLMSGPGLLRRMNRRIAAGMPSALDADQCDVSALLNAAMNGDETALGVLDEGRDAAAALLVMVIETLAPDAIVLGGGLCTDPCWYVEPIRERIHSWLTIPDSADTPVRRAELWDEAVLWGCIGMADSNGQL